jgi:peptidoglycan/LPS O-acetylase OafA/YrhL
MLSTTVTAPVRVGATPIGATPAATTMSRLPALDGVRGLAIATVLAYHGWCIWPAETRSTIDRAISALLERCWIGVDLFFVLSGFLITRILLRSRGKGGYYKNFYARRALRIFPLYYAVIFALCVVGGLVWRDDPGLQTLWSAQGWLWLYAYNIEIFRVGHWFSNLDNCWSLAVEEQFYLIWPMVVATLAPRRLVVVALGAAFACIALRAAMPLAGYTVTQIYVITPARCDGLMLGGAVAVLEHLRVGRATLVRVANASIALGAVVLVGVALRVLGPPVMGGWISTACTLTFAGALARSTVASDDAPLNRALCWRPLALLGKYSYGVYLLHEPLFFLAKQPIMHVVVPFSSAATNAARLAIVTPFVVGLAVVSFHYFETPFLRLKDRFAASETLG